MAGGIDNLGLGFEADLGTYHRCNPSYPPSVTSQTSHTWVWRYGGVYIPQGPPYVWSKLTRRYGNFFLPPPEKNVLISALNRMDFRQEKTCLPRSGKIFLDF
jgi:hypothetical protein